MDTITKLRERAAQVGLDMHTWSPGDGKTRYRFGRGRYYFDMDAYYTALGLNQAETWLGGYTAACLRRVEDASAGMARDIIPTTED